MNQTTYKAWIAGDMTVENVCDQLDCANETIADLRHQLALQQSRQLPALFDVMVLVMSSIDALCIRARVNEEEIRESVTNRYAQLGLLPPDAREVAPPAPSAADVNIVATVGETGSVEGIVVRHGDGRETPFAKVTGFESPTSGPDGGAVDGEATSRVAGQPSEDTEVVADDDIPF